MTEEQTDNFLAHFGVKGMKWGVRHDPNRAANRQAARVQKATARADKVRQRERDRQTQVKAQARAERNRDAVITKARKDLPKSARELRVAKADYRVNKHTMGRKAAKEVLNKYKNQHRTNQWNASMQTGKERIEARAEYLRQLQYREMMRQEFEAQRRREAANDIIREFLNPTDRRSAPTVTNLFPSTTTPTRNSRPSSQSRGRHVERGQGKHAAY